MRVRPRRLLAGAALGVGLVACHTNGGCASDVCTVGTVQHVGPAWGVRADDGSTYAVVPALPTLFQREGLRVRLTAKKHGGRGTGGARPVEVVRIETTQ
jgi:hypothetical protein